MPSSGSVSSTESALATSWPLSRGPRLIARLAALGEREQRERAGRREGDERAEREEREAPMASACLVLRALDRPLRLVTRLPAQHRARQDVVEDLPAARFVGSDDPVVAEHVRTAGHRHP